MAAEVAKIDSSGTGFFMARNNALGVLPDEPVWFEMEPNSYADFGGQVSTVARSPINKRRSRRKGTVVDLDASGGFQQDLTQEGLSHLWEGLFMCVKRRKACHGAEVPGMDTLVAVASDGTGPAYQVEAGHGNTMYAVGNLVFAESFDEPTNNGLKIVTAVSANYVRCAGLTLESPPSGARIRLVGHEFASGVLDVVKNANELPILRQTNLAAATQTLTLTSNVLDTLTVTIGSRTYTFQDTLTNVAGNVKVGASASATLDNLIAAINGDAGAGTLYAAATTEHPDVTAAAGAGDTMDITAIVPGTPGNLIATTETFTTEGSWGAGFMAGGLGLDWEGFFGMIPGEWFFIGGDEADEQYADEENNGFVRVYSISGTDLRLDKTSGGEDGVSEMVSDAGAGLTMRLFFGDLNRNESVDSDHYDPISWTLERLLGKPRPVANPTETQSEQLRKAYLNTAQFNVAQADKVTMDYTFIGSDHTQRTGELGVEEPLSNSTGEIFTLLKTDAFNSSNDFSRLKMAVVPPVSGSEAVSAPQPLFAYVTEATFNITNNVSPNKAVTVLGAFDVTIGQFEVGGSLTAYFADVAAVAAVRANSDVTIDWALVKDMPDDRRAGFVFDIPLLALGGGRANIEVNQPVTLPLEITDGEYGPFEHSAVLMEFWYLPELADA